MADKNPDKVNILLLLAVGLIRPLFNTLFPPISELIEQIQWSSLPVRLLGISEYVEMRKRGLITRDVYLNRLSRMGIEASEAENLFKASERIPQIGELIDLRLRKYIDDKEYLDKTSKLGISPDLANKLFYLSEVLLSPDVVIRAIWRGLSLKGSKEALKDELRKQGWTDEKIDLYEKVSKFYPSVDDFIRFMVRETFDEEVVRKYGYDEGYPKAIEEYVAKTGIDPEWMKHLWRAHWVLPSPTMGFEMLARGLITMDDLKTLFRIANYPPYWIDKLIKIAYTPYSRVDIRRMHKLGILTRDQVKRAYMDLGYDEEKAEALTKFTEALNAEEEKEEKKEITEPTRGAILDQYEAKMINRNEAKSMLIQTGLAENVAEFYLDLRDYEIERKRIEKYTSAFKKLYLNDLISADDVSTFFNKLNLPVDWIEETISLWDLEKIAKPSLPSKTDLTTWLKKGLITKEEFKEEMSKLGYQDRYIELYLASVK